MRWAVYFVLAALVAVFLYSQLTLNQPQQEVVSIQALATEIFGVSAPEPTPVRPAPKDQAERPIPAAAPEPAEVPAPLPGDSAKSCSDKPVVAAPVSTEKAQVDMIGSTS